MIPYLHLNLVTAAILSASSVQCSSLFSDTQTTFDLGIEVFTGLNATIQTQPTSSRLVTQEWEQYQCISAPQIYHVLGINTCACPLNCKLE